jgi:hypothetical protein
MPELPDISTRPDLSAAFNEATFDYMDWSPGHERRQYLIEQKYLPIDELCKRVEKFAGTLPQHVLDQLRSYMMADSSKYELLDRLRADPSYATGARCLREMIERAKAAHR